MAIVQKMHQTSDSRQRAVHHLFGFVFFLTLYLKHLASSCYRPLNFLLNGATWSLVHYWNYFYLDREKKHLTVQLSLFFFFFLICGKTKINKIKKEMKKYSWRLDGFHKLDLYYSTGARYLTLLLLVPQIFSSPKVIDSVLLKD